MRSITCTRNGHASAGHIWPDGVRFLQDEALTPEQWAELAADPWISVEDVPDPAPAPAEPAPRRTKPAPAEPAAPPVTEEGT